MTGSSRRSVLTLLASSALAGPLAGTAFAVTPARPIRVDQAARDPALVKVRAAALDAAKARDFQRLKAHITGDIKLDFGGGYGSAEFGRRLARHPGLWDELVWVLENGGRFERDGSFWAPYTFGADTGKLDVFEAGIVVADNVAARAEPRAGAAVLATLRMQVVKVVDWRRTEKTPSPFYNRRDWVKVELPGKKTAWVEARYVRSNVDFRAGFEKVRGAWKMTTFVAGD